jgi:hypothetical protein
VDTRRVDISQGHNVATEIYVNGERKWEWINHGWNQQPKRDKPTARVRVRDDLPAGFGTVVYCVSPTRNQSLTPIGYGAEADRLLEY